MKRFLARWCGLGVTIALLALVAVSASLLGPRIARAFTLIPPGIIYFDPVSVPINHTLHVHLVNQFGTGPWNFQASCKPTTPGAGTIFLPPPVTLSPGDGSDQDIMFADFLPPALANRVPVVCTILVSLPSGGPLPNNWSGKVASSVEIVDDASGQQTAILGYRHVVTLRRGGPQFCLHCN